MPAIFVNLSILLRFGMVIVKDLIISVFIDVTIDDVLPKDSNLKVFK